MINLFKVLTLLSILLYGCKVDRRIDKEIIQQIDKFNMNVYTNDGKKVYSIKSPYSSYNKGNNSFSLIDTTIYLFKDNKAEYIINSDISKLSNNNKILELNGNILIKALLHQGDKLSATNFIWNINNSEYLLTGNVKFENDSISLSSNKAILNNDNVIKFFNPVKYKIKNNENEDIYEINSENAYYDIKTKAVSFRSTEKRVRSKIFF